MPQYQYLALSESGVLIAGEGAAASPESLKAELESRGLRAQQISLKHNLIKFWRTSTVKPEDFILFVQEMMALLRAGLPLPEALSLASDRPSNPELGEVIGKVLKDVREGMLFSQACAKHPDVFDTLFLAALRIGEKTGELSTVLGRYQEFLRRRVALRKKISQALAYPLFLLVALLAILGVLFAFVMPRFVSMYANFDAKLPAPTRWRLAAVEHFPRGGKIQCTTRVRFTCTSTFIGQIGNMRCKIMRIASLRDEKIKAFFSAGGARNRVNFKIAPFNVS